jgi:hypothetical protein
MRPSFGKCFRRIESAMQSAGTVRAVLIVSAIVIGADVGVSPSVGEGITSDVAYVEAVNGRVIASLQGSPTLLDVLDVIGERTRLDLPANSELRICHYRTRKLLTLKGPLRASVSASGVASENGNALDTSGPTCSAPTVSTFQGGIISRDLGGAGKTKVSLQPSIKIVNNTGRTIRQVAIWDGMHQKMLTVFERNVARPTLADGQSYLLVVEQSDGKELKMMLEASAKAETGPLIMVLR